MTNFGNPIEIAAIVGWRVSDTTRAVFEPDDYIMFVDIQSEAAIRKLASSYPYDNFGDKTAHVTPRRQLVEGAMGMVEMALDCLSGKNLVQLDEARKPAMVNNLLVVRGGEKSVIPIINTTS